MKLETQEKTAPVWSGPSITQSLIAEEPDWEAVICDSCGSDEVYFECCTTVVSTSQAFYGTEEDDPDFYCQGSEITEETCWMRCHSCETWWELEDGLEIEWVE